jgi:hypothetical protein
MTARPAASKSSLGILGLFVIYRSLHYQTQSTYLLA